MRIVSNIVDFLLGKRCKCRNAALIKKQEGTGFIAIDSPPMPGSASDEGYVWKHDTCMDHNALVEDHLRTKAYLIAEADGFRKDPLDYWLEAKGEK